MFAGGGTGGHLFPAIALADELRVREPGSAILFIGTRRKIEARVVPMRGYDFQTIWISGFRRGFHAGNLLFPAKLTVATMQALIAIRSFRPDVVVGTGGYVSGPVVFAATLTGVPTLIHEQNSFPGATTRFLGKRVDEVHLSFESSRVYFSRSDNLFVTGNPTRSALESADRNGALAHFGFNGDGRKTLLCFGGSLGARTINDAVEGMLGRMVERGVRVIWQSGAERYGRAKALAESMPAGTVWVERFIDRIELAYAASDLVVCRAGATTIAELTRLGKPAVLLPYPYAAAQHQVVNAKTLGNAGAAAVVEDREVAQKLESTIASLLDDDAARRRMGELCRTFGRPGAGAEIAEHIVRLCGRDRGR